jgi:hypothetical protein
MRFLCTSEIAPAIEVELVQPVASPTGTGLGGSLVPLEASRARRTLGQRARISLRSVSHVVGRQRRRSQRSGDPRWNSGFPGDTGPFRNLIDYLERGHTVEEFLGDFPTVTREQVISSLEAAHTRAPSSGARRPNGPAGGVGGLKNGELLARAVAAKFEVFLTADQNLQYQQNLAGTPLFIVVIAAPSNALEDLLPVLPLVLSAIENGQPGQIERVSASHHRS